MMDVLRRMARCNAGALRTAIVATLIALGIQDYLLAQPQTYYLRAKLSGDNYPVPTGSPGSGFAEFTLVNIPGVDSWLDYKIQLFGVDLGGFTPTDSSDDITPDPNDNIERIHIHAGWPGATGPLLFQIYDVIGLPSTKTDDQDDFVIDISAGMVSGRWDSADIFGARPVVTYLDELLNEQTYLNIHTVEFPMGEIRGPLVVAIPEPAAISIAILGIVAMAVIRLRRRR